MTLAEFEKTNGINGVRFGDGSVLFYEGELAKEGKRPISLYGLDDYDVESYKYGLIRLSPKRD